MERGITIEDLKPGEIVYLNLAGHPGSGSDTTPPGPPRHVTQRIATNIHTQGVEVRWEPAEDNHWLSGYEVFRVEPDGVRIGLGKISKGEYVFDHSRPGVELISCRYELCAFDGDGNVSHSWKQNWRQVSSSGAISSRDSGTCRDFRGGPMSLGGKARRNVCWCGIPRPVMKASGCWSSPAEEKITPGVIARTFMLPHPDAQYRAGLHRAASWECRAAGRRATRPSAGHRHQRRNAECAFRSTVNRSGPQADWQQVPADRAGVRYDCAAVVKPGDRIEHILARNSDWQNAGIGWYGVIEYTGR